MAAPNPQAANLIWVLIAFILACVGVYYAVPKNHPDRVLYRTSAILSLVCAYLLWAITYMAQLNPIISPQFGAEE